MNKPIKNGQYLVEKIIENSSSRREFLVHDTKDEIKKCMKIINRIDSSILKELELLKNLSSPNVVKYYDFFDESKIFLVNDFCIVFEHIQGANLRKIIKQRQNLTEENVLDWSTQILNGLNYIHNFNIIHRDLNPENIYLKNNKTIVLSHFGTSARPTSIVKLNDMLFYSSPELVKIDCDKSDNGDSKNLSYDFKIDIWAFGCIVYELCTLEKAFEDKSLNGLFDKIENCYVDFNKIKDEKLNYLVSNSIVKEPGMRLEAKQFLDYLNRRETHNNLDRQFVDNAIKAYELFDEGRKQFEKAEYNESFNRFQESLELRKSIYDDENNPYIASSYEYIGRVYLKLNEFNKAMNICQKALTIRQRLHSNSNHLDLAYSFETLGDCHYSLRNYSEAKKMYTISVETSNKLSKNEQNKLQLAKSLSKLSRCDYMLDDYEQALKLADKSLKIFKELYGELDNPEVATVLNYMGDYYTYVNQHKKSLEYNKKSLKMRLTLYPRKDRAELAKSYKSVGVSYSNLNRHKKGLNYCKLSYEVSQRCGEHLEMARSSLSIGVCNFKLKNFKKARDDFHKSLNEFDKWKKTDCTSDKAKASNNLAKTYKKLKDQANFEKYKKYANELSNN